jgi:hypothetical protein
MTHHQESLDETIDRVAAHLTMVPADPALAARIADRLETRKMLGWPRVAVAGVAVAAIALLAVVVSNITREEPAVEVARATSPAPAPRIAAPQAAAPAGAAVESTTAIAPNGVARRRPAPQPADDPLPELPQIDALNSPALLALDTLPTDILTIEPVDLAPLGMADLTVTEIDGRDSPKE